MSELLHRALDPRIADLLGGSRIDLPPARDQTPSQLRQTPVDYVSSLWAGAAVEPVADVRDHSILGSESIPIAVRVYTPAAPRATIVYFHGGGFVAGSIDTHDRTTRRLANGTRARVVSVDYRLAPEHPFPAGPNDCYAATTWAATTFPDRPLLVAGDSAGGAMAIAVTLRARDRGGPSIDAQVLMYPAVDATGSTMSMERYAAGFGLTRADMAYYFDAYLPDPVIRAHDPYADGFRRHDLHGLPPALVTTAGFDPLLDEGKEYAARFVRCDVPTIYQPEPGLIHGYIDLVHAVPAASAARDRIVSTVSHMITELGATRRVWPASVRG